MSRAYEWTVLQNQYYCTGVSPLRFRQYGKDDISNSITVIIIIITTITTIIINIIIIVKYYRQSSAPHVRCQKTKTINDVIPSTDLYTTPEYTEYYTVL